MSSMSVDSLDRTIQETNVWLKAVTHRLEVDDGRFAFMAPRAVLHALRDRIGPENAVHLSAQLPMLVRGLYYEGWHMAGSRPRSGVRSCFWIMFAGPLAPVSTSTLNR